MAVYEIRVMGPADQDDAPEVVHRYPGGGCIYTGFQSASEAMAFARALDTFPSEKVYVELADGFRPYERHSWAGGPDVDLQEV